MTISIRGLNKAYGNHVIFIDLDLTIEDQKFTVLYGKSGCGKTTLLNIIGLIEPFQSGEIIYNGRKVSKRRDKRRLLRHDIGFIFQDFGLIENETIYDNMMLVYVIRKMRDRKTKIKAALEQVNINYGLDKKIHELSGGEQQRVAIAKLLLKDPMIILADEPTASLDEENRNMIIDLLRSLCTHGKTIIAVSHDPYVRSQSDICFDLNHYA